MSITALKVITAADGYPITLSEAKKHLRVTHSYEDEHIQSLIASATKWAEDFCRRIFVDTQVIYRLDEFPDDKLFLLGGVVSAVNDIDYTDEAGAAQTLTGPTSAVPGTDYQENLDNDEAPFICPARESYWPATQNDLRNAVSVDYQVGWDRSAVPDNICHAIKFKVAEMYVARDGAEKTAAGNAAEALLFPHVIQDM